MNVSFEIIENGEENRGNSVQIISMDSEFKTALRRCTKKRQLIFSFLSFFLFSFLFCLFVRLFFELHKKHASYFPLNIFFLNDKKQPTREVLFNSRFRKKEEKKVSHKLSKFYAEYKSVQIKGTFTKDVWTSRAVDVTHLEERSTLSSLGKSAVWRVALQTWLGPPSNVLPRW